MYDINRNHFVWSLISIIENDKIKMEASKTSKYMNEYIIGDCYSSAGWLKELAQVHVINIL